MQNFHQPRHVVVLDSQTCQIKTGERYSLLLFIISITHTTVSKKIIKTIDLIFAMTKTTIYTYFIGYTLTVTTFIFILTHENCNIKQKFTITMNYALLSSFNNLDFFLYRVPIQSLMTQCFRN